MTIDVITDLRWKLELVVDICKSPSYHGFPPIGGMRINEEPMADTLKRAVVEAEKCGLGDRAEDVFLPMLDVIDDPLGAIQRARRFLERVDALRVADSLPAPPAEPKALPSEYPHQVTEPQVVQKNSQPVKVNLQRWGIGHDGKTWWLFYLQKDGKRFRWETRGKIDIPTGNQNRVAMRMLKDARLDEGRAAISKDEMHELFAEDNHGKTPKSLQQSVITPTMNKLRSAIRKSLERVLSGNITADPIPYQKEGIWQSMVMFGVATKDDHGKLTLHLGDGE